MTTITVDHNMTDIRDYITLPMPDDTDAALDVYDAAVERETDMIRDQVGEILEEQLAKGYPDTDIEVTISTHDALQSWQTHVEVDGEPDDSVTEDIQLLLDDIYNHAYGIIGTPVDA